MRLVIRDDGQGFDPQVLPQGGQGVLGMRERARLLGGRLVVRSQPGQGTKVIASAPLLEESA